MAATTRTAGRDMFVSISFMIFFALVAWTAFSYFHGTPSITVAETDLRGGKVGSARREFDRMIAAHPSSPETYIQICSIAMNTKQWSLAQEYVLRGVRACKYADAPDRAELFRWLSWILVQIDARHPQTAAIEAARHALGLDPHSAENLNTLGFLLADNNLDLPLAQSYLAEAIRLARANQSDPEGLALVAEIDDSYGWLLFRQHADAKAVSMLTQAITESPDSCATPDVMKVEYYHLAAAYADMHSMPEAQRALAVALQYDPSFQPAKALLQKIEPTLQRISTVNQTAAPAPAQGTTVLHAPGIVARPNLKSAIPSTRYENSSSAH